MLVTGATLVGIQGGADMKNQSMGLIRTVLNSANLEHANLRRADLSRAKLEFATLTGADLRDAVFTGASFAGADLTNAQVSGLDLTGADVAGARLRNLSGLEQANGLDKLLTEIGRGATNRPMA